MAEDNIVTLRAVVSDRKPVRKQGDATANGVERLEAQSEAMLSLLRSIAKELHGIRQALANGSK